ncbi:MAG: restriction endonuclease subunit S [Flavobacterium sp.]|nr:restriction endonuclease subunit S [Flavobacterium sp.]
MFEKVGVNPNVFLVQSTDFDENRNWIEMVNPVLDMSSKLEKHLLYKDDVLFVAKGREFFAVVYDGKYTPAVASTTFLVMRVTDNNVKPEFIAWFLNHPKTQNVLAGFSKGTAINSVNIKAMSDLEIFIPSYAKQMLVLDVSRLQKEEVRLQNEIMKLKQQYNNELTFKYIK